MFTLRMAENGGWVVTAGDGRDYTIPVLLGAYTNTADAIVGLSKVMTAEADKSKSAP